MQNKTEKYDKYFYKNASHQISFKEKQLSLCKQLEIKKTEITINNDKINLNKVIINKNEINSTKNNNIINNNNNNINLTNISITYNNNPTNINNIQNNDINNNIFNMIYKDTCNLINNITNDITNNITNDITDDVTNNVTNDVNNINNFLNDMNINIDDNLNDNLNINVDVNNEYLENNLKIMDKSDICDEDYINTMEGIRSIRPNNIRCIYDIYYKTSSRQDKTKCDILVETWKKKSNNNGKNGNMVDIRNNKEYKWKKDDKLNNIISILNKITKENYKESLAEIRKYDYKNIKVVNMIFMKASNEINYMDIYANICYELKDIHDMVNELGDELYKTKKNEYLCKFIALLYKKTVIKNEMIINIINDLKSYDDMNKNAEIRDDDIKYLCVIIKTLTLKDKSLVNIDKYLLYIKDKKCISKKNKFMIMDILGI